MHQPASPTDAAARRRQRFATAPVARLATADLTGRPHVVPFTFAVSGDHIYFAVDHKPKRRRRLRRLENIAINPQVAAIADHYETDWSRLWWVRADGRASIISGGHEESFACDALSAKYPEYERVPPAGPYVVILVTRWSGWEATPDVAD